MIRTLEFEVFRGTWRMVIDVRPQAKLLAGTDQMSQELSIRIQCVNCFTSVLRICELCSLLTRHQSCLCYQPNHLIPSSVPLTSSLFDKSPIKFAESINEIGVTVGNRSRPFSVQTYPAAESSRFSLEESSSRSERK